MLLSIYWVAFLVGGTFVALALAGGHGHDGAGGHDAGHGAVGHDAGAHAASGAPGIADLLSLRLLMLFSAFFGLTGLALTYGAGEDGAFGALVAALVGLVVGLGGHLVLRRLAQERVTSEVTAADLVGRTGHVVVPMSGEARGQVRLVTKGGVTLLPARSVAGAEALRAGDAVVVVRLDGRTAEVVRVDEGERG